MKILFIASRFPYPAVKGDQNRVLNFLKYLSKTNQVYFVCTSEVTPSKQEFEYVKNIVKHVVVIPLNKTEQYKNVLLSPLYLRPFQVMFFYSEKLQTTIDFLIKKEKFDLIFCQMIRTAPYVLKYNQVPKVLDFQDAYSLNMEKRFRTESGVVKIVAFIEWVLLKRYERSLLKKFDLTLVVSERDKKVIGSQSTVILPIGIEVGKITSVRKKYDLVFSGNLRYFPNRDAITWFSKDVFPLIKKKIPGISLLIVGATPPADVLELAAIPGIKILANVPSIRTHLASAKLSIAPIRSGSGTQFKIIEALAAGTPVIASTYATEGIDFLTDKSIVVCEPTAKKYAREVIYLLNNNKKLKELALNGRREVLTSYTWVQIVSNLEKLLINLRSKSA